MVFVARHNFTIRVGAKLTYRDFAIRSVLSACKLVAFNPNQTSETDRSLDIQSKAETDLISAFSEIFNNIVLHGGPIENDEPITINISVASKVVTLEIIEKGLVCSQEHFSPSSLPEYPEGGMGFHIIRSTLDSFEYKPGPPNRWLLSKRFGYKQSSQGTIDKETAD